MDENRKLSQLGSVLCALWYGAGRWGGGGNTGSGCGVVVCRGMVRGDGVVLRQEINIFGSRLQFIRLPDRPAENIWRALGDDWSGPLSSKLGRQLTEQIHEDLP